MHLPDDLFRKRDFREWAMIHLISKFKLLEDGTVKPSPAPIDVVLTINGKEVDFLSVVDEIEKQHERLVEEHVKQLMDEKFNDMFEPIQESMEDLKRAFDKKCREVFPDMEQE